MRRPSSRSRPPIVGTVGLTLALALSHLLSTTCRGQEASSDATSLARYVPKDDLVFYIEFDGLDAHADAWKKTAAYKILNNTPTGAMLEEVATQLIDRIPVLDAAGLPARKGADLVTMVKHMAKSGFMVARIANKKEPAKSSGIFVVRNAFKDKNVKAILARSIQEMYAPNTKPTLVVRAGHKIVSGTSRQNQSFTWWIEETKKEDFVQVFPTVEAADVFLETLDGIRPNAIGHPRRAELIKPENGFVPTGLAFMDPRGLGIDWNSPQAKNFEKDYGYLGIWNVNSVDFRWGFQDEALMTIARIATSGPRKGLLSILDNSTLEKTKLPPIPQNVNSFTAGSFEIAGSLDRLKAQAKTWAPDSDAMIDKFAEKVKEKTKLKLKEDILAHIGPRVAWYSLPTKSGAPASLAGMFNPAMELPKFALVFDIDDPSAFGLVLDQAMMAANREFKAQGKPAGDPAAKGGRGRAPSVPTPEFRLIPGETKMYVLNVPQELTGQIPSTLLRPAIRVGPKQAVIAISAEVARAVLDSKASWSPSTELNAAFEALPSKLKVLNVNDPRGTLPALLSTLPGKLQPLINLAMMAQKPPPGGGPGAPGAPGAPNVPGGPGAPGAPGAAPAPGIPAPFVFRIDPANLPSAESIKSLLFPSLFTIESSAEEIRIVSRDAFPSIGDPSNAVILIAPAIQAMRAGRPVPGMVPPPGGPPPGGAPGSGRNRPGAGAAGNAGGGGNNPSRP